MLDSNERVTAHYKDAYRIAAGFHSEYLPDDIKENIALKSLRYAISKYDSSKGMAFTSYLHMCIYSELKSEHSRVQKLPKLVTQVSGHDPQEERDIFDFVDGKTTYSEQVDTHGEILQTLQGALTARQWRLLCLELNPAEAIEQYVATYQPKKVPRKLTWEVRVGLLGVSAGTISKEKNVIKKLTKQILKNKE